MKRKTKLVFTVIAVLILCITMSTPVFAITEDEVEAVVSASGRETVTGNIFIWFLCAIAFLKMSQKIDSFMSSLGINVGHTGGSMLAEAMIAMRAVQVATGGRMGGGSGGGHGGGGGGGGGGPMGGFMSGGLAGAVSRSVHRGAAGSVTGTKSGITSGISGAMYKSSLSQGGNFANNVTSSIARGRAGSVGTITGSTASAAYTSYMGLNENASNSISMSENADNSTHMGGVEANEFNGGDAGQSFDTSQPFDSGQFSNVEIGGGRITGIETNDQNPQGIPFALYSAESYMQPTGAFTTVSAVDKSTWYKQYGVDKVEKTPHMTSTGDIEYTEKVVKDLPTAPIRKDRL